MTEPRALSDVRCAAIWNGCRCARRPHNGEGHVWRNTLDGDLVDPALYPAVRQREVRFIPQECPACGAFIRVAQPLDAARQPLDVEALRKIADWQTHGPLQGRDAEAMVALARAVLTAKDAERCQRPVEPASVGLDWCSVHGGRWRFGDDRCGLARLTAKDADHD